MSKIYSLVPCVHFTTNAFVIGHGLEEQIETFIAEHPDTVMAIIDTMQMIRSSAHDTGYANDYRELSVIKKLADKHGYRNPVNPSSE